MTTTFSKHASSSAETSQRIKSLLKELPEERADAARLDELRRLFARLVTRGELTFTTNTTTQCDDSSIAKWNAFLQKCHSSFVSQLCQRIEKGRITAVRTMLGVIASSPLCSTSLQYKRVNENLVQKWMKSMLHIQMNKAMRTMVEKEFLHVYRDVQYYTLIAISKLAAEQYANAVAIRQQDVMADDEEMQQVTFAERLFQFLLMIPIPTTQEDMEQSNYLFQSSKEDEEVMDTESDNDDDEESVATNESKGSDNDSSDAESSDEEDDNDDTDSASKKRKRQSTSRPQRQFTFQQLKSHRKALSNAWLAVLKLPALPTPALKSALQFIPSNVIPHVPNPLLFADFFMQAYNYSGVIGVLALDGLFVLMTQYGLEYPLFYTSLYRLVAQQPSMLYVKYKTRFFQLLTKCLCRNEMLPAHLVASFCKRLLRSALNAPPPGILFTLALVANLLRKHPECSALIHREGVTRMEEDPFDAQTHDPTQTRALETSLWELSALSHHYYPAVATLAKSIGTESETTPMHDIDDFLRHTYKSLFEQERKRSTKKRRKVPLTFVEPKGLFSGDDVLSGMLNLPEKQQE